MNDLETLLPEALDRARSEGMTTPEPGAKAEVIHRIRRRRMARTTSSLTAAAVLIAGGIWGFQALRDAPREVVEQPVAYQPLPEPPETLTAEVPSDVRHLIVPGLVQLYREDDGDYHAAVEGVGNAAAIECPQPLKSEACPQASASLWVVHEDGSSDLSSGNFFDVPEVPEGAEVLWSSPPPEGAIGIDSMGACDRIERFVPDYECEDGEPVPAKSKSVRLSRRGNTIIPVSWHRERRDPNGLGVFELNVSTSPSGAAHDEDSIAPDDAFVTVRYLREERSSEEFPEELDPDDFEPSGESVHGEPIQTLTGTPPLAPGASCYICYDVEVAFWTGPDASRTTWAQARFAVESLKIPYP